MTQLLPGDRFVGNGMTRVLDDFLMIPKADVDDAAFHFRPDFKGVLSTLSDLELLVPPPSTLAGKQNNYSSDDDDGRGAICENTCTLQPPAGSID